MGRLSVILDRYRRPFIVIAAVADEADFFWPDKGESLEQCRARAVAWLLEHGAPEYSEDDVRQVPQRATAATRHAFVRRCLEASEGPA